MTFDLNRVKARRAARKATDTIRPPQQPSSSSKVRCIVNPHNGEGRFEADFVAVPRIGEAIDLGPKSTHERQQLRVTRVLHLVGNADPAIQIDVTNTIL